MLSCTEKINGNFLEWWWCAEISLVQHLHTISTCKLRNYQVRNSDWHQNGRFYFQKDISHRLSQILKLSKSTATENILCWWAFLWTLPRVIPSNPVPWQYAFVDSISKISAPKFLNGIGYLVCITYFIVIQFI